MKYSIIAMLLLSLLVVAISGQNLTDAPVAWTTYNIGEHKLSIRFPKLPIRFDQQDPCNEKRSDFFSAYASEVVYTLTVVSREKPKYPLSACQISSRFGLETLSARRSDLHLLGAKQTTNDGKEMWQLARGTRPERVWIIDDLKNHRWIELNVTGRGDFPDEAAFVRSLELDRSLNGLEVGEGSPQTLGDRGVDTSILSPSPVAKPDDSGNRRAAVAPDHATSLTIISKVKARYTDAARRKREVGVVTLRVSFLANGGIGDISVIKGLQYGLTEQAIAAARKLVFLPPRVNGQTATTSRPVSFFFSIY